MSAMPQSPAPQTGTRRSWWPLPRIAWIAIGVVMALVLAIVLANWITDRHNRAIASGRASAHAEVAASFSGPESLVTAYLEQLEQGDVVAAWAIVHGVTGDTLSEDADDATGPGRTGAPSATASPDAAPSPGATGSATPDTLSTTGASPSSGSPDRLEIAFDAAQPLVCATCYRDLDQRVADPRIESVTYAADSLLATVTVSYQIGSDRIQDQYRLRRAGSTDRGYPQWEFASSPFARVTVQLPAEGHAVIAGANCDGAATVEGATPTLTMAAAPGVYPVAYVDSSGTEQHWTITVPSSSDPVTSSAKTGAT